MLSRIQLFEALWTVACQSPLSQEFSRQEYRSGLPFHTPGDLPDPGIEPKSLASPEMAVRFFTTNTTWEAPKPLELILFQMKTFHYNKSGKRFHFIIEKSAT